MRCVPPPHGLTEIKRVYGDIRITRVNGKGAVVSPQNWEDVHCIVVRDLPGFESRPLYINRWIEEPLREALAAAKAACPNYLIRTMGCFNPRKKKSNGTDISLHSWAVAVDINADTNPMGAKLVTDMPDAFIKAFLDAGFVWGGEFRTPDAMHFQLASGY